jgi:hypothetical protein
MRLVLTNGLYFASKIIIIYNDKLYHYTTIHIFMITSIYFPNITCKLCM